MNGELDSEILARKMRGYLCLIHYVLEHCMLRNSDS